VSRRPARRGLVLLGVLLIVALGALVGTTLVVAIAAERSLVEGALGRERAHAMAWSGVLAATAELADQRDDLLAGVDPDLTDDWTLIEAEPDDPAGRGVVRLVPFDDGALARAEAARVDLNTATAEALAALPGISTSTAGAIVRARAAAPFASIEELARDVDLASLLAPAEPDDQTRFGLDPSPRPTPRDLLTVFAFDPETTAGVGDAEPGLARLDLGGDWTDERQAELEERLGPAVGRALGAALRSDDPPASLEALVTAFGPGPSADDALAAAIDTVTFSPHPFAIGRLDINRGSAAALATLPGIDETRADAIDTVTFSPHPFAIGRLDINRGSAAALATLPGIDETRADAIVAARERLDAEQRRSTTWLLETGELTRAEFAALADRVTTRSTVWRVRVEAGFDTSDPVDDAQQAFDLPEADEFGVALPEVNEGSALRHRVVLEAVIDVSARRPRIAYLRDVTSEPIVSALRSAAAARVADGRPARTAEGDALEAIDEVAAEEAFDFDAISEPEAAPAPPSSPRSRPSRRANEPQPEPAGPAPRDRRVGRWTDLPAGGDTP